ncbi:MAG: hypothetical protein DKINENOH_05502 [bacterium]|nr:hypothetical protein [bacterium]
MHLEQLNEPITVRAVFNAHGEIEPSQFDWRGKIYAISHVYTGWNAPGLSQVPEHHLTVAAGGDDTYELVFSPDSLKWRLAGVLWEK